MATATGKIQFRHRTAIVNNAAYDVSANVLLDTFVTGSVAGDSGTDGMVMVRDSTKTDGWGWLSVAGLITPVVVAEGGTGLATVAAGGLLYGAGTSNLVVLAAVAAGQVLVSGAAPGWSATPSLTSVALSGSLIVGTNPASAGAGRFANNSSLNWRNAANTGDFLALYVDASNNIRFGDTTAPLIFQGTSLSLHSNRTAATIAASFTADFFILCRDASGANFYVPGRNASW
jgi:hypothetical protein